MSITTLTSKGQITLPKEVRDHFRLAEGDRVEFVIEPAGDVHVRPLGNSVKRLFGIARRPGTPALSVEEMDEAIAHHLAAADEQTRNGEG